MTPEVKTADPPRYARPGAHHHADCRGDRAGGMANTSLVGYIARQIVYGIVIAFIVGLLAASAVVAWAMFF